MIRRLAGWAVAGALLALGAASARAENKPAEPPKTKTFCAAYDLFSWR